MENPRGGPAPHVVALDHVVLIVRDVERSLAWYHEQLGLVIEGHDAFLAGDKPFASLRIDAGTIIDLLPGEPTGRSVDHIALVVDADIDELAASGRFDIESAPSTISGARGQGRGVYLRDPDGHRVELRGYPAV